MVWAVLLVALPIIIHFFLFKGKPKVVDLPTVRFLHKRTIASSRRRIRQILLLLLRTLIIIFVILAAARPVIKRIVLGRVQPTIATTVILLDDSYSMAAGLSDGTSFARAKKLVGELLKGLAVGSRVALIPLSETEGDLTLDLDSVRKRTERLKPTHLKLRIASSLKKALEQLQKGAGRKETFIISDFTAGAIKQDDSPFVLPPDVECSLVKTNPPGVNNSYLSYLESTTLGDSLHLAVTPLGRIPDGVTLSAYLTDGKEERKVAEKWLERVSENPVTLPMIKLTGVEFEQGYVELSGVDSLPEDNRRYFTINSPPRHNVLIVGDDSSPFLEAAAEGLYQLKRVRLKDAVSQIENLGDYQLLVLDGLTAPPQILLDRLTNYLAGGGNILILLGPGCDVDSYAQGPWREILPAVPLAKVVGNMDRLYLAPTVGEMIVPGLGEEWILEEARFDVFHRMTTKSRGMNLLVGAHTEPALVVSRTGRGKVVIFFSGLGKGSGPFFKSAGYPVLVGRILSYAGSKNATKRSFLVGDRVTITPNITGDHDELHVRSPGGIMTTARLSGGKIFYSEGDVSGNYQITIPQVGRLDGFSVNLDPEECSLNQVDAKALAKLFPHSDIYEIKRESDILQIGRTINEERFREGPGLEITGLLALLAILLVIAEGCLSRWIYRRAYTTNPATG